MCSFVLILALCVLRCTLANAQTRPDAGSVLRQFELSQPVPKLPELGPPIGLPRIELLKGEGSTVLVSRFAYRGNLAVRSEDLDRALANYVGRELNFAELQNAAATISLIYRERGLIASASIPQQSVVDGVVDITIVEARFAGAEIDDSSKGDVHPDVLQRFVDAALPPGQMVNVYDIDRALLLLNDLPGVSVTGGLQKGTQDGETSLVLVSNPKPLISGAASLDNFGSTSTGTTRFVASINANGSMGMGDLVSVNGIKTDGSDYGQITLAMPVGSYGTKFSLNASAMQYRIISSQFSSGNFTGTSEVLASDLQHPLLRSRSANLYIQSTLNYKHFSNLSSGASSSNYNSTSLGLSVSGNLRDEWMGGGQTEASLGMVVGYLNLSGSANESADASGAATAGSFAKLKSNFSRSQTITPDLTLAAKLSGQWAFKNLDSSEKFYLGGSDGIRAYPSSEGSGSSGYRMALEGTYSFVPTLKGQTFIDSGAVQQYVDNNFSGGATNNYLNYSGYGVGIIYEPNAQTSLQGVWSRRLGTNPYAQTNGNDQDGTLLTDRFWLSGQMNF